MNVVEKLNQRVDKVNSLLSVGLDPDFSRLPEKFKKDKNPQFEFNKFIMNETYEFASTFKMNIAFYEERGAKGYEELKMTMDYIKANFPDIYSICDCKRGDVTNTNIAYTKEMFDFFDFDAITVHPYFGRESLKSFLARKDKGIIILCRSSNSGAGEFQDLLIDGKKLWEVITEKVVSDWNYNNNCLLMVGSTYPEEMKLARKISGDMTILSPGSGAQGGDLENSVRVGINSQKKGLVINASRSIIFSENPKVAAKKLRDEINKYRS